MTESVFIAKKKDIGQLPTWKKESGRWSDHRHEDSDASGPECPKEAPPPLHVLRDPRTRLSQTT
jgi:hypothetical protein